MLNSIVDRSQRDQAHWNRELVAKKLEEFEAQLADGKTQNEAAENVGIPRTTLLHWLGRKNALMESSSVVQFFESPEGLMVLHRICVAAHVMIELDTEHGIRGVCKFLEHSGLATFIASSYGARQQVSAEIEAELAHYGEVQQQILASKMPPRKISIAEDENFHQDVCLIGIEPVSNFILLETMASKRDEATWNQALQQGLEGLPVEVVQSTSDEGKGLVAHVKNGLHSHHSPDLYHINREISKGFYPRLNGLERKEEKALTEATKTTEAWKQYRDHYENHPDSRGRGRPPNFFCHISEAEQAQEQAYETLEAIKEQQQQVSDVINGINEVYHPYDLTTGQSQSVETIKNSLEEHFEQLDKIANAIDLNDFGTAKIAKARKAITPMLATIAFFFKMITANVKELALPIKMEQALYQNLIPGIYLQKAATKAKTTEQKQAILQVSEKLLAPLRSPESPFIELDKETLHRIEKVAVECAELFQRSSSCVEGRNGQLSLWHHHLHHLRPQRLQALTIIHNYFTKRSDGTTAAERFFDAKPDDLFEWLVERIGYPKRPAKKRPAPKKPCILNAQDSGPVPSFGI